MLKAVSGCRSPRCSPAPGATPAPASCRCAPASAAASSCILTHAGRGAARHRRHRPDPASARRWRNRPERGRFRRRPRGRGLFLDRPSSCDGGSSDGPIAARRGRGAKGKLLQIQLLQQGPRRHLCWLLALVVRLLLLRLLPRRLLRHLLRRRPWCNRRHGLGAAPIRARLPARVLFANVEKAAAKRLPLGPVDALDLDKLLQGFVCCKIDCQRLSFSDS